MAHTWDNVPRDHIVNAHVTDFMITVAYAPSGSTYMVVKSLGNQGIHKLATYSAHGRGVTVSELEDAIAVLTRALTQHLEGGPGLQLVL